MEQEEYEKENIGWRHISFTDNRDILEMIGVKAVNIFSLIDEEAKFPRGTDATLLTKLHLTHGDKTIYRKPKYESTKSFGIQHFAGTVFYKVAGFLEKNRDAVSLDLRVLAANSSNLFLRKLFETDDVWENGKKPVTLLAQFKNSLELLIKTLSMCEPFFIRCIKPNEVKKSKVNNQELIGKLLSHSLLSPSSTFPSIFFLLFHSPPSSFSCSLFIFLSPLSSLPLLLLPLSFPTSFFSFLSLLLLLLILSSPSSFFSSLLSFFSFYLSF